MKADAKQKQSVLSSMSLLLFFETLSTLLSSGVALEDCLKLMCQDAAQEKEKQTLHRLHTALMETYALHAAMQKTGLFPAYAVSMVQAGEHSGNLEKICASLADHYEQENQQKAQIKGAVLHPFILICIMAVVIAFLVNAILPVFSDVYAQMGIHIEANSMIRIALLVGDIAMWALFALLLLLILSFLFYSTKRGKQFFEKMAETSVFTRKYHAQLALARFTLMFAMLLESGKEVAPALQLAGEVSQNSRLRTKLKVCLQRLHEGDSLASVLTESGIFNPTHSGVLTSGIRSGAAPRVLRRLSQIYEQTSSRMLHSFLSLIEPLLIGVLSLIIGLILLCIMLPLIGILSSIG
jgi:type IV pilus assembly protein PilC